MKRCWLLVALLLTGCATFSPDEEIIVRELHEEELGGAWAWFSGSVLVGGCRVSVIGAPAGCLRYTGARCAYTSPACE